MGIYLLQPNSKPSFAHTQRWGLSNKIKSYTPALFLTLNEGGGDTVIDLSGREKHGVITGAVWVSGGLYFDGTSTDKILCDTHLFEDITDKFTLIMGIRADFPTSDTDIHMLFDNTDNLFSISTGVRLEYDISNDNYKLAVHVGGSVYNALLSQNDSFQNQDKVIYARYDGSAISVGIIGVEEASISVSGNITTPGGVAKIGSGLTDHNWKGDINFLYLGNQALPTSNINSMADNFAGVFNPGFDLSTFGGVAVSGFQPAWAQNSTLTQGIPGVV